ncbi:hypothetical protein DH2020_012115 [Rehmannia glutinosa]|uniref:Uncharacterized protein n=1 Tax=Rehmannia glutinosa TaxID=99300 RepID=A0ABR0XFC6_REHGL
MQMAISGDLSVSAALNSYKFNPSAPHRIFPLLSVFANGASSFFEAMPRSSRAVLGVHTTRCHSKRPLGIFEEYKLSQNPISQEVENFLLNAINMNFFERLNLAWKIIFPSPTSRKHSNANIAKQRLKMILFSDHSDPDLGTIYSVTVPVRRVRSEYQLDDETGAITNIEYKDTGESSGSVDVKFDFYIPSDKFKDFSV